MKRKAAASIEAAFLLSLGLVPLIWFRQGYDALAGFDFALYLDPGATLRKAMYLWSDLMAAGYDTSHEVSSIPYYLLYSLPMAAGLDLYSAEKAVFCALFGLQGLSMRYMLSVLFQESPARKEIAVVGALLYAFSFPVMAHFGRGNMMPILAYGLMPVLLGLLYRGITEKAGQRKLVLLVALLSLPIAAVKGHPADFVVLVCTAAAFVMFFALAPGSKAAPMQALAFSMKAAAASLLVNLWWVVPNAVYLAGFRLSQSELLQEGFFDLQTLSYYSSGTSFLNVFRNRSLDLWFDVPGDPVLNPGLYDSPLFVGIGLGLCGAAALSAAATRHRAVGFFSILLVAALFLAKGSHAPFGRAFEWMYLNVPGFFFFRAPYRVFSSLVTFSLTPLLAFCLGSLACKAAAGVERARGFERLLLTRGSARRIAAALIVIFSVAASSAYAWPVFTGAHLRERGTPRVPGVFHTIPGYYSEADEWLKSAAGQGKVYIPYQVYDANTRWGYNGPDPAFELLSSPKLVSRPGGTVYVAYQGAVEELNSMFVGWDRGELGSTLAAYGARYALINWEMSPWALPEHNFNEYAASLLSAAGFDRRETGPLAFYENKRALPRIYGSQKAYLLAGAESSFPALSLTGHLDRPFLVFAGDAGGSGGLGPLLERMDGVVLFNSNETDAVSEALSRGRRVFGGSSFETAGGPHLVLSRQGGALRVDGREPQGGAQVPDGVRWKAAGVVHLDSGSHLLSTEQPGQEAMVAPLDEFLGLRQALEERMRGAIELAYVLEGRGSFELDLPAGGHFEVLSMMPESFQRASVDALDMKAWEAWFSEGRGTAAASGEGFMVSGSAGFRLLLRKELGRVDAGSFPELDMGGLPAEVSARALLYFETDEGVGRRLSIEDGELRAGRIDIRRLADERFGPQSVCLLKRIEVELAGGGNGRVFVKRPSLWGRFGVEKGCEGQAGFTLDNVRQTAPPGCGRWAKAAVLAPGRHSVELEGRSIVLVRRGAQQRAEAGAQFVEFTRTSPTRYSVKYSAGAEVRLVMADSFDGGWSLLANGKRYSPVRVNGISNGFVLDEGEGEGVLEYAPQRYYRYSALASALSLAGVVIWSGRGRRG